MDIFRKQVNLEPKSKKWMTALIVPLGIAAIGVPVYVFSTSSNLRLPTTSQSDVTPIPVQKPVNKSVAALGRIQTKDKIINLSGPSALQSARLDRVLVKDGNTVRKGQLIAILDNVAQLQTTLEKAKLGVKVAQSQLAQVKAGSTKQADIAAQQARIADLEAQFQGSITTQQAKITRLEAELKNAQTEYGRFNSLYKQGAISASTNDTKRLAVDSLEAQRNQEKASLQQILSSFPNQIKEAKASLGKLKEIRPVDVQVAQSELEKAITAVPEAQANIDLAYIRAPIDGKILKVNVFPGETIGEKGIVDLAQTQEMYVVAEVYETEISKIQVGQKATISSRALPKELTGKVEIIGTQVGKKNVLNNDPALDIDSRVAEVKIRLNPTDTALAANFINLQVDSKIEINPNI
jgi:HlyD family secretion protein